MRLSWEEYALEIARVVSLRSEDPYVRVGCCLLRHDNSVLAVGYNGAPPGVEIDWSDRDMRRMKVSHAENSALRWAKPGEVWLAATTISPCPTCLVQLASYGVKRVVYGAEYDSIAQTKSLADEFGIELIQL